MNENASQERREYADLTDLAEAVRTKHGGVRTLTADVVRDCTPHARLGSKVRAAISEELADLGIRHLPEEFPDRQWEAVRLYAVGTPAGDLIDAVRTVAERTDTRILEIANNSDQALIEQIRRLVCQPTT